MSLPSRVVAASLTLFLASCAGQQVAQKESTPVAATTTSGAPSAPVAGASGMATGPARAPIVVEGTGSFVAPAAAQPQVLAGQQAQDGYQLSFIDTDIAAVAASVLGDGLGVPYTVDPKVKGTMTLQAPRPLSREEVLVAFEAALRIYGAALLEANGVYTVVQSSDAPRRTTGLIRPGEQLRPGFGIQIVPLRYVSVSDMEKILRPLAVEGAIVRVDEARNMMLLAGTSQELASLLDVVRTFDVDWLKGMSFALFPLEYVDPKTVADELGSIFSGPDSPIADVVRFVPLSRLNSLMVVSYQSHYLREVETWIKRLDLGVSTPGRRIYIYDVQNGKAADLADSLSRILSLGGQGDFGSSSRGAAPRFSNSAFSDSSTTNVTSERSRSIGGTSATGVGASVGAGTSGMSLSAQESGNRQQSDGRALQVDAGDIRIEPNEESNSLMILASPSEFSVIEAALKRLDVAPIQVMIEASLAEVTLNNGLRYGLQWEYQHMDGPIVFSEASNGSISPQFPGFSYLFTGRQDIRAVLNAIQSITDVNVLSSPKLLVLNNREAELQIGDQVPIVVQSAVSTADPNAPIVNAVQLRDTGVILRVIPRVNKNGLIMLEIAQEVSDVVPTTTSGIDSPTIQQRKMASTLMVRDGETIALGGLIREGKSKLRSGVPILRHIPLIGDLVGSTSTTNRRTELIVLITPRVIRSSDEASKLMEDLEEEFKGLKRIVPQWRDRGKSARRGKQPATAPSQGQSEATDERRDDAVGEPAEKSGDNSPGPTSVPPRE